MDVNLIDQMRLMTDQAQGSKVEKMSSNESSFGTYFQQAMTHVNDLSQHADSMKSQFEMGDSSVGLGEVMVASQKASLGFEATVRVRNKLVQAYQDIMNMPV